MGGLLHFVDLGRLRSLARRVKARCGAAMAFDRRDGSLFVYLGEQMSCGVDRMTFKTASGELRWPDENAIYDRVRYCRAEPSVKDRWLQEQDRLWKEEKAKEEASLRDSAQNEANSVICHSLGRRGVSGYSKVYSTGAV